MNTRDEAKLALQNLVQRSRVHLYKPIQIAEILYRDRTSNDIDLAVLETYRSKSKHWRDVICRELLGRVSTSSARFQDDLFNENAIPPRLLVILGEENRRGNGSVEAYIYRLFTLRYTQVNTAFRYVTLHSRENFDVVEFIELFWSQPGLRRSLDKIFEIVVYSLFSTLAESLELKVSIEINQEKKELLQDFQDFTQNVMSIDFSNPTFTQDARVYRVGVTNAADRGLDMYSNWGPAIQIKHLGLSVELAESIVNSISSDRVVIVCKTAERDVILSLLAQIGWKARIQSIVTEDDLSRWYTKALRGKFSNELGDNLISRIKSEVASEFPSVGGLPDAIKSRNYEIVTDEFWKQ
jgi:hypothetical protein